MAEPPPGVPPTTNFPNPPTDNEPLANGTNNTTTTMDVEMKDDPIDPSPVVPPNPFLPQAPEPAAPATPVAAQAQTPTAAQAPAAHPATHPPSRNSPHPAQPPQQSVPSHPNPHGSSTRMYLNQHVTPHLLEAMKYLATQEPRPEKPLKWLSEFLAQKSSEIEDE